MEGAKLREQQRLEASLFEAWHMAVFALSGYAGKLKPLSQYLGSSDPESSQKLENAKLIAGFQTLKARGFDIQITRNPIN